MVACAILAVVMGGATWKAAADSLAESSAKWGCDTAAGYVHTDGGCVLAQVAGAPPELLELPPSFRFGVATASYQVEGGAREGGRGSSTWDDFSHEPGRTANGDTGDVACDSYHRFMEDITLLKALGVTEYRLSIAWPRVMPDGRTLNPEGMAYYRNLFTELRAAGVRPLVTLFHWDLPSALEREGGWLNETMIVAAFEGYAREMFRAFGDVVKRWTTFNEAFSFTYMGCAQPCASPAQAFSRAHLGQPPRSPPSFGLAVPTSPGWSALL